MPGPEQLLFRIRFHRDIKSGWSKPAFLILCSSDCSIRSEFKFTWICISSGTRSLLLLNSQSEASRTAKERAATLDLTPSSCPSHQGLSSLYHPTKQPFASFSTGFNVFCLSHSDWNFKYIQKQANRQMAKEKENTVLWGSLLPKLPTQSMQTQKRLGRCERSSFRILNGHRHNMSMI